MKTNFIKGLGFAAALMLAACGPAEEPASGNSDTNNSSSMNSTAGNTNPGNSSSTRDGRTECGNDFMKINCEAGQYCEDQNLMICELGCLSDNNCTAAQTCQKAAGENVGTCQTTATGNNTSANNTSANNTSANNTSTNNTSSNNTSTNNTSSNNTSSNNTAASATCEQVCNEVISCDASIQTAECLTTCNTSLTQAIRDCVVSNPTCADIENNCFGGVGNNTSSNNSSNNTSSGAVGSDCSINSECDDGYCRKAAGAFDGKCAVNDFGNMCEFNSDCEYGACLFAEPGDIFGYCTATCESFTDCPTFWSCEEVGNAGGDYCIND